MRPGMSPTKQYIATSRYPQLKKKYQNIAIDIARVIKHQNSQLLNYLTRRTRSAGQKNTTR